MRDIDADSDDDDDNGINPRESTPTEVSLENVHSGTIFTQVAAGDSITLAVTDDGLVYGCGTFRCNDGVLGFTPTIPIQPTLIQLPGLKAVTHVCCGDNHTLALSTSGGVRAWGSGEQHQLGRRIKPIARLQGLIPREFGLPRNRTIVGVGYGAYHSFALSRAGDLYAWGLNSYGQTGLADGAGDDAAFVRKPRPVPALTGKRIVAGDGDAHHSIAVTAQGECLVWGRMDGAQCGIAVATMPAAALTGLGTIDDVPVTTRIANSAVSGRRLVWAGAGGQFGMLAAEAGEVEAEG
ncbi:hypothetical protein MMC26_000669 [Xylographa opegraphella]|nr:hypothetical protein [Xylographa opegraphella]